jgi:lipopolysaccharide transport system permease protein
MPVAITFLMLLTPVVYPIPQSGLAAALVQYNPLTPLISATRDWLTLGATTHTEGFVLVSLTAVLFLIAGWVIFRVAMPHLISRIGN